MKKAHIFSAKETSRRRALALLGLSALALYAAPTLVTLNQAAASGGGGASGGGNILDKNPLVIKECSECHDPYSAKMLPSGSWRKIMNDLPNHFGEDASLGENTRKQIADYLAANAGGNGSGPIRISQTRWFKGEHRGEVNDKMFKKAKSWSNCTSCHY
ncbi:MAG: cytochrome C [Rhodospirillaceae bacterium]|nr:cytochrome C [Rhodospirillaceae bacterium]